MLLHSKLSTTLVTGLLAVAHCGLSAEPPPVSPAALTIHWQNQLLTIHGSELPGDVTVHYLEAYCRPGSTDRDWSATVIGHTSQLIEAAADGRELQLRDTLRDGVIVSHHITADADAVNFRVVAHNPTDHASLVQWAQPCMRVDRFTGCSNADALERVPQYVRQCFLFVDGRLTHMPTEPWATQARYTPGQVYCPRHVDRNDVNPRPLSVLVPSNGLCGCFSRDNRWILAVAWEPYQEIFQGVIACLHNDFRIGGLQPGETKTIRGKIYIVPNDVDALLQRFHRDFPEEK